MFREFSEEFGGSKIAEAWPTGVIVIGDKGVEIGVGFGMVEKAAMVAARFAETRPRWSPRRG